MKALNYTAFLWAFVNSGQTPKTSTAHGLRSWGIAHPRQLSNGALLL
jgi:hypothetical protein